MMSLQQKIESIASEAVGMFGVSIKHLNTQEEVNINENRLFQTASVVKIPILAALMEEAYKGNIDLHKRMPIREEDFVPGSGVLKEFEIGVEVTIKDMATMMIIVSDNLATDKVLGLLGADHVQRRMHESGMQNMYIKHSIWELLSHCVGIPPKSYNKEDFNEITRRLNTSQYDMDNIVYQESTENNVSTPKDMTRLLEMIAKGEFVSKDCSDDIIDILLKQQLRQRIPRLIPYGTKIANKTGSLATIVNDAGIVYMPENKGAFVMSVFSKGVASSYDAERTIVQMAQTAYQHFLGE
ncbi:serine hydrolase [Ammoniphilus sp. CFH 90114]|uniref:serine hydrolase n=1 Tax=Ammoniphilus sp. CFH 90114 TaxID=2493665 RepID=UPI00100EE495|nr:serine hydrolase [Ammoniphilus sp. CFH 90114]RXT06551.1 serine hydrolase [Ammoniphilus sp. CFH 90114]